MENSSKIHQVSSRPTPISIHLKQASQATGAQKTTHPIPTSRIKTITQSPHSISVKKNPWFPRTTFANRRAAASTKPTTLPQVASKSYKKMATETKPAPSSSGTRGVVATPPETATSTKSATHTEAADHAKAAPSAPSTELLTEIDALAKDPRWCNDSVLSQLPCILDMQNPKADIAIYAANPQGVISSGCAGSANTAYLINNRKVDTVPGGIPTGTSKLHTKVTAKTLIGSTAINFSSRNGLFEKTSSGQWAVSKTLLANAHILPETDKIVECLSRDELDKLATDILNKCLLTKDNLTSLEEIKNIVRLHVNSIVSSVIIARDAAIKGPENKRPQVVAMVLLGAGVYGAPRALVSLQKKVMLLLRKCPNIQKNIDLRWAILPGDISRLSPQQQQSLIK